MPTPRMGTGFGTVNEKIFVIGGFLGEASGIPEALSRVEEYDPGLEPSSQ